MQFPKYISSLLLFQLLFMLHASADKLTVSGGRVIRQGDRHFIEFTVAWKLSWHNDTNWAEGLALRARNYAFDTRSLQMANRGFGNYAGHYRNSGLGFPAARTAD